MKTQQTSEAETSNPHWIGNYPAWDIHLTNGDFHQSVTEKDIRITMQELRGKGLARNHELHVDVVRKYHIVLYNKFHTEELH